MHNIASRYITIMICFVAASQACATKNIREIWRSMPDSLSIYVDSLQRRDLVSFADMGLHSEVRNLFDGTTSVDTLTDTYMSVRMSSSELMQMRLLPAKDSTQIVCLVRTFGPVEGNGESDVRFFTTEWNAIESAFGLPICTDEDSLLARFVACPDTMASGRFDELRAMIDPVMLCATLSAADDTIRMSLSAPLLTKEEEREVRAIIRKKLFKWDGETFK